MHRLQGDALRNFRAVGALRQLSELTHHQTQEPRAVDGRERALKWPLFLASRVYIQEARKGGAPLGSRGGAGVAVLALVYGATVDTGRRRGPVAEARWALWPRVSGIVPNK